MTDSIKLKSGELFPTIEANLLDGSAIELGKPQAGADWQMVVVYRGKHCPLCLRYLNALENHKEALAEIGVSVVAISADSKQQLTEHMEKLTISYPIAYGLTEAQMKELGVYISAPRSAQETDHNFSEPALFVINEQGRLQMVNVSNAPFLRPDLDSVVHGLGFVRNQADYPIRGTVTY
ncbi:redoxin family protein [Marinomonas pollencensis]|uniref:Peroxiredoxin n=1 Tax=Marinomonas pollencensis TaxID=491954 RepID=A0A3E0DJB3_9GAMM|nr:redoxin family protein [Marinomonas pollencensis]REG82703.1 peroxiredoxin [Marinomonas pollencensis]